MKKALIATGILLTSSYLNAVAEAPADKWLGNWSSKSHANDVIKGFSIVRDKQDIKVKFTKYPDGDYMGEGIAEWYPQQNGNGAFITNFTKDAARMHVVIVPNSKNQVRTSIYTKYDDGKTSQCFTQNLSRTK